MKPLPESLLHRQDEFQRPLFEHCALLLHDLDAMARKVELLTGCSSEMAWRMLTVYAATAAENVEIERLDIAAAKLPA